MFMLSPSSFKNQHILQREKLLFIWQSWKHCLCFRFSTNIFLQQNQKYALKYRPIQISSKINSSQVSSAILIQMKQNVIKHFVDFLSGSAAP